MSLALADHVHAVQTRNGLAFLDVQRDAYFCVYTASAPPNSPVSELLAPSLVAQLRDQGLLANAGAPSARWPQAIIVPDWIDPAPVAVTPVTLREIVRFGCALFKAAVGFHRRDFAGLIARGATLAEQGRRSDADQIVAARFERLCLFLPFRMQCLFRSWFLLHYLRASGLSADWVFAVTLFPFHAHCWLANGARLVGERIGQVEDLVPILILGPRE